MRRLGLIGFFLGAASLTASPVEQSLSPSRQFIVYGTDLRMRGVICDLAERTKRELRTLLDERDNWTTPIIINAQYPQANLPELPRLNVEVGQTGFGLKLQLDLVVNSQTRSPEIRRELLRALILERMYRGRANIAAGTAYTSPPDWLLDGIPGEEADLPRARLASLLALPVSAQNVLPLEKFLAQRPELLEAAGRTFYRAYSFALVDLLSHSPDGPRRLTRLMTDLPVASNDPMGELRNHFPELFEKGASEKTWAQQITRLSTEQPYQLMGPVETERMLAEKLRIRISEGGLEKRYELEEFAVYLKLKSAKNALGTLAADLGALATRANPLYAPIIAEYLEITARLSRRRTLGIAGRLERLRTDRHALTAQMREIDDYLNWFEATSLPQPSGDFNDYIRAAERAIQPEQAKRDPISVYLTAVEAEFEE
jgi:hypothetical protein